MARPIYYLDMLCFHSFHLVNASIYEPRIYDYHNECNLSTLILRYYNCAESYLCHTGESYALIVKMNKNKINTMNIPNNCMTNIFCPENEQSTE